jgi:phenylalanyl-tRNA synthetase alpha chain
MHLDPDHLVEEFTRKLETVHTRDALAKLKAQYLGRKGKASAILSELKDLAPEQKKAAGMRANQCKNSLLELVEQKSNQIGQEDINRSLIGRWQDITLAGSLLTGSERTAGCHPVTRVQEEIEDIFLSMGFEILDGPHIEDDYHNFEALNFPPGHPARDMQDTFWFGDNTHLLRTHTSCIQVRGMKSRKPPFKFVGPGKVFRCEATDASHEMVFHQLEGMMVGWELSVANLIYFMQVLIDTIFQKDVKIRLRPGYFPFVEPGFELDIACLICSGKGCSVCKQTGWVELLPCGMVHPNVLSHGGIEPDVYNGFAFGLGLDRLVMMRYGIDDIRLLHSGNLSFVTQFASY